MDFKWYQPSHDVVQDLVIALMVIVAVKDFVLGVEVAGQEAVFQQYAVLKGLMPSLDLAWRLGMIKCTERMRMLCSCTPSARSPET